MSDDVYRDGRLWTPFYGAGGWAPQAAPCATTLPIADDAALPSRQPVGFRGAAPGQSHDERGLPRVRVKAGRA